MSHAQSTLFELCFPPLLLSSPLLRFPCDARGDVQLDALSERAREDYLFARTLVGRDYARPEVREARESP